MKKNGFASIVIVVLLAVIGIMGYYFFGAKNILFKSTPTPVSSMVPTPPPVSKFDLQTTTTAKPQATSRPTVVNVNTTGKLVVNFHPLYTEENVEDYAVKIYKQSGSPPLVSSTGHGNNYMNDNLSPGSYTFFAQTGRGDKYCGVTGNGTNTTGVQFDITAGQRTTLNLDIFPYPGFVYLKTKDKLFPIANAKVSTGYYSTTTDALGRAVLYSINPGPYNLNISYTDGNFDQQITGNDCMWIQRVDSPLTSSQSVVNVKINSTVNSGTLYPELIIKDVPMDIKPNAIGNGLVYDTIRKFSLNQSSCAGLNGSYFNFSGNLSYGPTIAFTQVDPGDYGVCVYNINNPNSSYASSVPQIHVSEGNPVEVTVDYPRQ